MLTIGKCVAYVPKYRLVIRMLMETNVGANNNKSVNELLTTKKMSRLLPRDK
jgi:hypothetical protein